MHRQAALLCGYRHVILINFYLALNIRNLLRQTRYLRFTVQQGIGQIKLRTGARLQLLNAFLFALDSDRVGIAGARLNPRYIPLF